MDRPTMNDIARAARVSQPTVSLILSGNGERYTAETRARVIEAAKRLNYQPNIVARSLQARKSFLFGVLLNSVNSELLPEFSRGIQDVAAENHYAPVVFTHSGREEEARCLERCLERRVDGLIINAAVDAQGEVNAREYARLLRADAAVVEVFGHFIPRTPSVAFDAYEHGRLAVRLLHERGHRRVALYIVDVATRQVHSPTGFYWAAAEYCRGYTDMAGELNVEAVIVPYAEHASGNGLGTAGAFESAAHVFRNPIDPTAIICNSEAAQDLSMYAAINRAHVRPDLTLLTAGAPATWHRFFTQTITLPYPLYDMGRRAAEMLLARLAGENPPSEAYVPIAGHAVPSVPTAHSVDDVDRRSRQLHGGPVRRPSS